MYRPSTSPTTQGVHLIFPREAQPNPLLPPFCLHTKYVFTPFCMHMRGLGGRVALEEDASPRGQTRGGG